MPLAIIVKGQWWLYECQSFMATTISRRKEDESAQNNSNLLPLNLMGEITVLFCGKMYSIVSTHCQQHTCEI